MLKLFKIIFGKNRRKKEITREITVIDFIGDSVWYDEGGTYFWGQKGENLQMIGEVRGWGAIQNLFKKKDGSIDMETAAAFQDELGKWMADAMTYKILIDKSEKVVVIGDKKGDGTTEYPVPERVWELLMMISQERDDLRAENDRLTLLNKN